MTGLVDQMRNWSQGPHLETTVDRPPSGKTKHGVQGKRLLQASSLHRRLREGRGSSEAEPYETANSTPPSLYHAQGPRRSECNVEKNRLAWAIYITPVDDSYA